MSLKRKHKTKEVQEFAYSDKTIVEREMFGHTSNNRSQPNGNKKLKKILKATSGENSIYSL